MSSPALNLLPYAGTVPRLGGPPQRAAAGHALIGRVTLGRAARLGAGSVIRADGDAVVAGDGLDLGRGATVHIAHESLPTHIGARVTVGANAVVHACTVGDDCVIEEDCVILDGSTLGAGVLLQAGSVVYPRGTLQPGWLYAGKPAKPVRALDLAELAQRRAQLAARNADADPRWPAGTDPAADAPGGAFVANTAWLTGAVAADTGASVWYGCRLDARAAPIRIGARSNVQDNSVLTASGSGIVIGTDTTLGHNVAAADCRIGARCLIGMGSRLAAGTVVPDDVFVAAGAVTTPGQVLESGYLWGGAPARRLAPLDDGKRALVQATIVIYCGYADELARVQRDLAPARSAAGA